MSRPSTEHRASAVGELLVARSALVELGKDVPDGAVLGLGSHRHEQRPVVEQYRAH